MDFPFYVELELVRSGDRLVSEPLLDQISRDDPTGRSLEVTATVRTASVAGSGSTRLVVGEGTYWGP